MDRKKEVEPEVEVLEKEVGWQKWAEFEMVWRSKETEAEVEMVW